jgi:hypothetical protein
MLHFRGRTFARDCVCCPAGPSLDRRSFLVGGVAGLGALAAPAVLGLSGAVA